MRNVFNYDNDITTGIIMTTATVVDDDFEKKLTDLGEQFPGKNVSIIHGSDFASWILVFCK